VTSDLPRAETSVDEGPVPSVDEGIFKLSASGQQIARAAGLVMALFIASRVLGLAREIVIARQFGTSAELDAYLAAFRLPDLLFQLVAGGALGSAFIPTFTGHLAREDLAGAWRLTSAVINWVLLILTTLALLAAWGAPLLVARVVAPGFSPPQQALTAELMRLMLISTVVFGVSGVVMGALNARRHFLLPALAPIIYNLAIIGGALLLGPRWGVRGLAIGVVTGACGHLVVQLPELFRQGMNYHPILAPRDPGVREVARLMAPRALGLAAVQLNFLVNIILASSLTTGSIVALNYAFLLMLLPQGIFAQAVATAAFPTFSILVAQGAGAEMRRTFANTLRAVLYLSVPAAVGLVVLRRPLVALLLQRGAFTADSTAAVAWALLFYALGLVGHAAVEILARAFYALHDTKTPVAVGVAAMLGNVGLSLAFLQLFRAGGWAPHGGLALANSVATTAEMAALLLLLRGRLGGLEGRDLAAATARIALGAALMGAALALYVRWGSGLSVWASGGLGIALGAAAYLGITWALGAEEPTVLLRIAVSKVSRRR
jgi:putative peptidoglycan lipid II flippase